MLKKTIAVIIGCGLVACGIDFFLVPFHILDGGVIGLSLIVSYIWQVPVGLVSLIISIPLFVLAWMYSRAYFFASIQGLCLSAFLIDIAAPYRYLFLYYIELSPVISALIGGALIGLGLGIMLRNHTSTGGFDMLAHFVSSKWPINVGFIIAALDVAVIALGGMLLSEDTFLLSAFTVTAGGLTTGLITLKIGS